MKVQVAGVTGGTGNFNGDVERRRAGIGHWQSDFPAFNVAATLVCLPDKEQANIRVNVENVVNLSLMQRNERLLIN